MMALSEDQIRGIAISVYNRFSDAGIKARPYYNINAETFSIGMEFEQDNRVSVIYYNDCSTMDNLFDLLNQLRLEHKKS